MPKIFTKAQGSAIICLLSERGQGGNILARIILNETSYHGAGSVKELAGEIKGRGLTKAFVCSDPDLLKFGVTKKATDVLDEAGIPYEIFRK